MKTILTILCLVTSLASAQSTNEYLFYKWNGTAFAKEYKTTFPAATHDHTFSSLTSKPTTLSGYGITDAQPLSSNLTTLAGVTSGTTGRNLLASGAASTARGWLGLSSNDSPTFFGLTVQDNGNDYPVFTLASNFGSVTFSTEEVTGVRLVSWPDASGTVLFTDGNGSALTALNASNITSGSLALARIAQGGATTGQALVWNGSAYAPATVSAPVTSVAGRTGAITLSTSDISGLGTIATQAADNVAITGGSIALTGTLSSSLNGAVSTPAVSITGTWYSGGTSTTTKPQVLIQPTGATSTAWSTGGTGLGVNSASGFTGKLWDFQANGTSIFSYSLADGYIYVRGLPALIYEDANTLAIGLNAISTRQVGNERLWVVGGIGFAPLSTWPGNNDTYLMRRALNVLGMGQVSATPATQYMGGQDASGTNATGGDYVQRPGNGTGSGKSGKWAVETAPPGSSGSTATTMVRRIEVDELGVIKVNNATTVPASNPSGGGYLFSEGGALKWRGSSGTVTTIANP